MRKRRREGSESRPPPRARAPCKRRRHDYLLRLFICGLTPRSTMAMETIRQICQEHLCGRHELQVIDMYRNPEVAKSEQIVTAPTLIKMLPLPVKRVIGDLRDRGRVLAALDLPSAAQATYGYQWGEVRHHARR